MIFRVCGGLGVPLVIAAAAAALLLAGCPNKKPLRSGALAGKAFRGVASWYGQAHHGRLTASGEPFDMHGLTAAHRRWRFGTLVRVTRLSNGKSVVVRINDRGPYKRGLFLDLSREAARRLGMLRAGRARVECVVLGRGRKGDEDSALEREWERLPIAHFVPER